MLHYYSFKNFQSFKDAQEVSFMLNSQVPHRGWEAISSSGQRLSTAVAVMGANGSGKTALLKPLVFAVEFMSSSFHYFPEDEIPLIPYIGYEDEPTEIELVAEDKYGTVWKYVLKATKKRVIHEALYQKVKRFNYVFVRDWNGKSYDIKQQNFALNKEEAMKVRQNASLLSTASQYGVDVFGHKAFASFVFNLDLEGRDQVTTHMILKAAESYHHNAASMGLMTKFLTEWDLGLSGLKIEEEELTFQGGQKSKYFIPFGLHKNRTGGTFQLPLFEESSGTQSCFVLLSKLLPVLQDGGLAVIDEIENDLHPHMVEPILDLFTDPNINTHNAQIIFTCHSPEVLDFLQKSQVIFVEKNDCESVAFRGDEISGLRSDDNLRAKYMSGALGAVPWL